MIVLYTIFMHLLMCQGICDGEFLLLMIVVIRMGGTIFVRMGVSFVAVLGAG